MNLDNCISRSNDADIRFAQAAAAAITAALSAAGTRAVALVRGWCICKFHITCLTCCKLNVKECIT